MSTARVHKAAGRYASGRMTNGRKNRNEKQYRNKFVAVVLGGGVVFVFTFLLWTIAMVVLQALEQ
jgi:hypothetical protein